MNNDLRGVYTDFKIKFEKILNGKLEKLSL
jgi:hypothetical protein